MKYGMCASFAIASLIILAVSPAFGSPAFAFQAPPPFSADYTMISSDGSVRTTGKMYFSAPRVRMDIASAGKQAGPMGGNMSTIADSSTQTSYVLMPQQHMYMEFAGGKDNTMMHRLPKFEATADPCAARPDATCKKVGTESANGRTCDKWELTEKNGNKETYWIDQKLHFSIKTQTSDMTTEFTNIKEGAQDPALFQIPAGYQKMDSSMMGRPRSQ